VVTQAVAFCAPVALCVAVRRSRARDVAACAAQMWAYVCAYKTPHDDSEHQARRVHIDYPIVLDRALGFGELPTVRLQRALARRDRWSALDRVLVWTHWLWFVVPHATLLYEFFWKDGWGPLYDVLGGNPLAAMPSLHFATTVMAAAQLAESGPVAGTVGWAYALALGFALVYLGEHYVVDLVAGAALTAAVRRYGPRAGPMLTRVGRAVAALEAKAYEAR
jgi:hypothetical protein